MHLDRWLFCLKTFSRSLIRERLHSKEHHDGGFEREGSSLTTTPNWRLMLSCLQLVMIEVKDTVKKVSSSRVLSLFQPPASLPSGFFLLSPSFFFFLPSPFLSSSTSPRSWFFCLFSELEGWGCRPFRPTPPPPCLPGTPSFNPWPTDAARLHPPTTPSATTLLPLRRQTLLPSPSLPPSTTVPPPMPYTDRILFQAAQI